jgi:hypothetical protein
LSTQINVTQQVNVSLQWAYKEAAEQLKNFNAQVQHMEKVARLVDNGPFRSDKAYETLKHRAKHRLPILRQQRDDMQAHYDTLAELLGVPVPVVEVPVCG